MKIIGMQDTAKMFGVGLSQMHDRQEPLLVARIESRNARVFSMICVAIHKQDKAPFPKPLIPTQRTNVGWDD
jgi:hypothetical protein